MAKNEDPLISEALRLYRRYQTEAVEALRLCPWAEPARKDGRVALRVLLQKDLTPQPALAAVTEIEHLDAVEIGLLIFPRIYASRLEFERFVARLVQAETDRRPLGEAPFAMAAFHPDASADLSDPERLVPFIRRTPDPTIQLVRRSALESVREGFNDGTQFVDLNVLSTLGRSADDTLPLRERIARFNHRTITRLGAERVAAIFDDICRDRDDSYARFGLPRRNACRSH